MIECDTRQVSPISGDLFGYVDIASYLAVL